MILQLDPRKWFPVKPAPKMLTFTPVSYDDIHATCHNTKENTNMATSPVIGSLPVHMTWLQHFGTLLRKGLHIEEEAESLATPFIAAYNPAAAKLLTSVQGLIMASEATASATTGTGTQKLAQVLTNANPLLDKFLADNDLGTWEPAAREKWINAAVDTLNLIPGPKAS